MFKRKGQVITIIVASCLTLFLVSARAQADVMRSGGYILVSATMGSGGSPYLTSKTYCLVQSFGQFKGISSEQPVVSVANYILQAGYLAILEEDTIPVLRAHRPAENVSLPLTPAGNIPAKGNSQVLSSLFFLPGSIFNGQTQREGVAAQTIFFSRPEVTPGYLLSEDFSLPEKITISDVLSRGPPAADSYLINNCNCTSIVKISYSLV